MERTLSAIALLTALATWFFGSTRWTYDQDAADRRQDVSIIDLRGRVDKLEDKQSSTSMQLSAINAKLDIILSALQRGGGSPSRSNFP